MYRTKNPVLREAAKQLSRQLRKDQTNAEQIFWQLVRNRQLFGLKFYRQYPLFFDYYGQERFFIADFFCFEKKLVVELDGAIHDFQKDYDELRTHIINTLSIEVVRYGNKDIECNLESVIQELQAKLR